MRSGAPSPAAFAATYQPLDSDLTAMAALSTTSFGRALLASADAAALLVASGGQASDSDLTAIAALSTTAYGRAVLALQDQAALVALLPSYQPVDSDLTSIAALTTTSFGRALLALADAAALLAAAGAAPGAEVTGLRFPVTVVPVMADSGPPTGAYVGSGVRRARRAAGASTNKWSYEICLPIHPTSGKGSKPTAIDIQYQVSVDGMTEITALLWSSSMPANGNAVSPAAVDFTYDAAHDTTGERVAIAQHTMTLSITTPAYFNAGQRLILELILNGTSNATAQFDEFLIDVVYSMTP